MMDVDVQLIANLVTVGSDGSVLLVRYDDEDDRWWLPGGDLAPFEHPDAAVDRVVSDLPGIVASSKRLSHVESFRGRRGWHVVFHYRVDATGDPTGPVAAQWFEASELPPTVHRPWEAHAVKRVLAG